MNGNDLQFKENHRCYYKRFFYVFYFFIKNAFFTFFIWLRFFHVFYLVHMNELMVLIIVAMQQWHYIGLIKQFLVPAE